MQLFVLALWTAGAFGVANYFMKQGQQKIIAIIFASPVFITGLAIAFFEVSEMNLLEFITKNIRTHFFDTNIKYQVNISKPDEIDMIIKRNHSNEETHKIVFKTAKWLIDEEDTNKVRESGLL